MARAFLFVLDSLGVGGSPDASAYGDTGADTLGHIAEFCAAGAADRDGAALRAADAAEHVCAGDFSQIAKAASGAYPAGMPMPDRIVWRPRLRQ